MSLITYKSSQTVKAARIAQIEYSDCGDICYITLENSKKKKTKYPASIAKTVDAKAGDYFVKHPDHFILIMREHDFKRVYLGGEGINLSFSNVLELMKLGYVFARRAWSGSNMTVKYMPARSCYIEDEHGNQKKNTSPFIARFVRGESRGEWIPTSQDCVSDDWSVVAYG